MDTQILTADATLDCRGILLAVAALASRVLLSATFIQAGVHKIRYRAQLTGVIGNYRLLPAALVPAVAWLLPPLELAVGLALLVPSAGSALIAGGLLGLFTAAMVINLLRGRTHIDCGCFQSGLRQELGWELVWRNGVLMMMAAYAAWFPGHPPRYLWVPAVLFGLVSNVLYQVFNALAANRSALRSLAPR